MEGTEGVDVEDSTSECPPPSEEDITLLANSTVWRREAWFVTEPYQ